MKKTSIFLLLFVTIITNSNAQYVIKFDSITIQPNYSSPTNFITSIHSSTSKQVDDNIYGFDLTGFFDNLNNKAITGQSTAFPNSNHIINNPTQLDSVYYYAKELRPKILRYTASSDWYHFRSNSKRLGADTAEAWNAFRLGLVDAQYRDNVVNEFNNDKRFTRSQLYDLIAFVKRYQIETSETIKIIYSGNTFQHMLKIPSIIPTNSSFTTLYNETYNAVKLLQDSGLIIYGVELGNETYYQQLFLNNSLYNTTQNKLDYVSILKEYSTRLKSAFPGIKISVPMIFTSPFNPAAGQPGQLSVAIAQDNSAFDAYSYHPYTSVVKNPNAFCFDCFVGQLCSSTNPSLFTCYTNGISNYLQPVGQGDACNPYLYTELRAQRINPQFNSYSKKIWLTEWNNAKLNTNNSLVSADYVFRYVNFLIDNKDSLNLGATTHFSMGGIFDDLTPTSTRNTQSVNTYQYSSLNPCSNTRYRAFTYMNESGINRVNLLANYFPFKFLSQIFTNNLVKSNTTYNLTIPNNSQVNEDNLMVRLYADNIQAVSSNARTFNMYLFYSNKSNQTVLINYDSLTLGIGGLTNGIKWKRFNLNPSESISQEFIQASSLNYFFRNSNYKQIGNGISILPNTIGYIKIPVITLIGGIKRISNPNVNESEEIQESKLQVTVYPNPTNGFVSFNTNDYKSKKLEIYTVDGKLIYITNFEVQNYEFDMSNYPKAQYIYKIYYDTNVITGKIVVE